jgi:hypothetical protein
MTAQGLDVSRSLTKVVVLLGILSWALIAVVVIWAVPVRRGGEGVFFVSMLGCLLVAEWPWRQPALQIAASLLRGVVVIVALLWLSFAFNTYSITRNGFAERVTEIRGSQLTPFLSGVWTMKAAVDRRLEWANYPIFLLTVQAVAAGIRSLALAHKASIDNQNLEASAGGGT